MARPLDEHHAALNSPIGKNRLEALADGVFAIVMTLLVLELIPREPVPETAAGVRAWLGALSPKVLSYVLSFVVVAIFWVAHHSEFHFIRHTDRRHLGGFNRSSQHPHQGGCDDHRSAPLCWRAPRQAAFAGAPARRAA